MRVFWVERMKWLFFLLSRSFNNGYNHHHFYKLPFFGATLNPLVFDARDRKKFYHLTNMRTYKRQIERI